MAFLKTELFDITCDMCGKHIDAGIRFPQQYAIIASNPTYVSEKEKGVIVVEAPYIVCRDCAFGVFYPTDGKFTTANGKTATVQITFPDIENPNIDNISRQSNQNYWEIPRYN